MEMSDNPSQAVRAWAIFVAVNFSAASIFLAAVVASWIAYLGIPIDVDVLCWHIPPLTPFGVTVLFVPATTYAVATYVFSPLPPS